MEHLNSFQQWAGYARAFGWTVTPFANWVRLERSGESHECMTVQGVLALCGYSLA